MSDLFTATTAAEVEKALARGEDIEKEENNMTPLTFACKRGELEVVDCLLNHGADPNHFNPGWMNSVQWAAREGHIAIVERLVRAGGDINDDQGRLGATSLIYASREGHVDVVDCLL